MGNFYTLGLKFISNSIIPNHLKRGLLTCNDTEFFAFSQFFVFDTNQRKGWYKFFYKAKEILIRDLEANLAKALALVSTLVMNSKKHCHPLP